MPDNSNAVLKKYIGVWKSLTSSQKTRIIVFSIIILASVFATLYFTSRPNYENLMTGSPDEIGDMSKVLTENSIEHKVENANTLIKVKAKDKDNAQIILAQSGYLEEGMKFSDAVGMISFSTTTTDRNKIYREYDENKIAQKLKKIENIKDATVTLSVPEKTIFLGDSESDEPAASVVLTTSSRLSSAQIEGVVRFVASSVDRLSPKNVTVLDSSGALLNEPDTENGIISGKQYEIQNQKKKEIEKQVKELLLNITDNVVVVANAVCDFDQQKITSVEYSSPIEDSDTGMLRSESTLSENVENGGGNISVPGTDSNQGGEVTIGTTANGGTYKKEEVVHNYELNQTNTETIKTVGNLDPVKSSLTVNLMYGIKFAEPPTDEEIERITKMTSTATGINENNITVATFKINPPEEVEQQLDIQGLIENLGPYVLMLVILIVFIVIVMKKSKDSDFDLESLNAQIFNPGASQFSAVADEELSLASLQELELSEEASEVKKQIDRFIKKEPEAVAMLLKTWIEDIN